MTIELHIFPYHIRKSLIEKMTTDSLLRMRGTCSEADSLVERHSKVLSGRVKMGLDRVLVAQDDRDLRITTGLKKEKFLKVTPGFESSLKGISIKSLHLYNTYWIVANDREAYITKVLETLEVWKPHCEEFSIDQHVPFDTVQELINRVWVTGTARFHVFQELLDWSATNLLKVPFPGEIKIEVARVFDRDHVFVKIKQFHRASFGILTDTVFIEFLQELNTSEIYNLHHVLVNVIRNTVEHLRFPYLKCAFPDAITLWENEENPTGHIGLVHLNEDKSLLVKEYPACNYHSFCIHILPRNAPALLNYLEKNLDLHKFIEEDERVQFMDGDEQFHLAIMRLAFCRQFEDYQRLPNPRIEEGEGEDVVAEEGVLDDDDGEEEEEEQEE